MDNSPTMKQIQTLAIEQLVCPKDHQVIVMSKSVEHQLDPSDGESVKVRLPKHFMLVGLAPNKVADIDVWGIIEVPEDISAMPDRASFKYELSANGGYQISREIPIITPNQYRQIAAALRGNLVEADEFLIRDARRYRYLRDEDSWGEDSGDDCWARLGESHAVEFDSIVDSRMNNNEATGETNEQ